MWTKFEDSTSTEPSKYSIRVWGPYLSKILGAIIGLVYSPLTLPFIYAGHDTFMIHETNNQIWDNWFPKKNEDQPINYFLTPLFLFGNTLGRFLWLIAKFPVNFGYSFYRGAIDGYKGGFLRAFMNPAKSFNQYDSKGNLVSLFNQVDNKGNRINIYQFRSQHLLTLALMLTVFISAIVTLILYFFPVLIPVAFTPVSILFKATGIKLATVIGINTTGYVIPLLNFATTALLTFSGVLALESAVFALIYLGKSIGVFFQGIIDPKTQSYDGRRITFALKKIISLIDKCVAIVVGMPLYILYKPCFQLLDSLRMIVTTDKEIWKEGKQNAETTIKKGGGERVGTTLSYEYAYKAVIVILILGNTAGRIILLPFQVTMSLLYAPLQCVRHATKYGISHVLAYPYRYANSYRNKLLVKGKENKEYRGEKENYKKIHVAKADNVYYFKKKHIALLAVLSGLAFVLLASFIPPLGYISISLSVNALTPLGLFQISTSGAAVLIINFLTGALTTTTAAIGLWTASWLLFKTSAALQSIKRFLTNSKHFHNIFHTSISAGDAMRILTSENFAVKTLASPVDGQGSNQATPVENEEIKKISHSWFFNLKLLLDPAGVWVQKKKNSHEKGVFDEPRPIYNADDATRKYDRNRVYRRLNLRTNETEIKKMGGERGRRKFWDWFISKISLGFIPAYTKKTSISLAPKDGIMAFFGGREDPIGFGFDLRLLHTKGEKYVFAKDAYTNQKWWWKWRYTNSQYKAYTQKCLTIQELRNINQVIRRKGDVPEHNEIMACLTAKALTAVVVSKDELKFRINAIFRKMIIKQKLGIDLPILMMGTLNMHYTANDPAVLTREYTVEEQIFDLYELSKKKDNDAETIFDAVATQYNQKASAKNRPEAKKDFVRTLVNTHPVNWATLFNDKQVSSLKEADFKQFIQESTGINLSKTLDYKSMETHLGTCVT